MVITRLARSELFVQTARQALNLTPVKETVHSIRPGDVRYLFDVSRDCSSVCYYMRPLFCALSRIVLIKRLLVGVIQVYQHNMRVFYVNTYRVKPWICKTGSVVD